MRKICLLLFAFILSVVFSSCSLRGPHLINRLFDNDAQVANKTFEQLLDAIENKDKDKLKKLFAKNILQQSNIDSNIDYLFSFFQGKIVSYSDFVSGPMVEEERSDNHIKIMQSNYDVETDKQKYRFAVKLVTIDTNIPDNIGINSIYIIHAEDTDVEKAYWGGYIWNPGINIEYNES